MMKHIAILFAVFCLAESQRPFYAGSSNRRYPQVLPQYVDERLAANPGGEAIGSRINGESVFLGSSALGSVPIITSTIPPDLPVDALGDIELINRIKTWPRDQQPFWYLNWRKIQEHRGDTRFRAQSANPQAFAEPQGFAESQTTTEPQASRL